MWASFKLLTWQAKAGIIGVILAILLAIIGSTAYVSYNKGLNVSKVEISQYETKVQTLNAKLATAQGRVDTKVVTEYVDRKAYIDRVVYKTRTVVQSSVPEQFTFSKGWVYAYNQSVRGLELDPVLASDKTASSISDMRALADTIAPNNGICLANKQKADSLQQWIRETNETRDQINNSK